MKIILGFSILCVSLLYGCAQKDRFQEKFNNLKAIDYSEFKNMSIVNRKGVYIVTYNGFPYKIRRNFLTNRISSIERAFINENYELPGKEEAENIGKSLKSFDKLRVQAISVDERDNVLISLPWYDRCTYYFLRLSSMNTLKEIKKQYYQKYEDNWYIDKECAER